MAPTPGPKALAYTPAARVQRPVNGPVSSRRPVGAALIRGRYPGVPLRVTPGYCPMSLRDQQP